MEDEDKDRFKCGQKGDHMCCPFQCDLCHHLNIKGRLPAEGDHTDELLLKCIRRVNLDSLWARERSTVQANWLEGIRYVKVQSSFDLGSSCLPQQGPYPIADEWGVQVACGMML